jgi:hypothetical protein
MNQEVNLKKHKMNQTDIQLFSLVSITLSKDKSIPAEHYVCKCDGGAMAREPGLRLPANVRCQALTTQDAKYVLG